MVWPALERAGEITKIVIGVAISALGPLVLAGCAFVADSTHHPVPLYWAIGFHLLNDIGFANVLPVGLALYSRAAPKGLGGMMIAVYYVHLFMGNMLTGYLGGLLGTMPNSTFWLMHVVLMAASGSGAVRCQLRIWPLLSRRTTRQHRCLESKRRHASCRRLRLSFSRS